jgi:hypothetical protein
VTGHRRLQLEQPDLSRDDLERMARAFRDRVESSRLKLHQMGEYAKLRTGYSRTEHTLSVAA